MIARGRTEQGFTLIELMVATLIGTLVILAALTLLDTSVTLSGRVTNRIDASQRSRLAMEQITRELRSQVCLNQGSPAILSGTPYSITFYDYLATVNASGNPSSNPSNWIPQLVTIGWNSSTNQITEKDYAGSGSPPSTTFAGYPASPTTTRVLLTDVAPPPPVNSPIFQYYGFGTNGQLNTASPFAASIGTPLASSDALNTVGIGVQFVVSPSRTTASKETTTLQNTVYVRSANPNAPGGPVGAQCQ